MARLCGCGRRRWNWAFWGSLAASVVIVCTVMANVLPKLYHLGYVSHGEGTSGISSPSTGPAPFIVEPSETPSVASRDQSKPSAAAEDYAGTGGFLNAPLPVERGENTFVRVSESPLSSVPTLSAYPDDASKLASIARFVDNHQLPPADVLRTDEIINALPYHYAAPAGDEAVSVSIELAGCPWDASHRLLRVGLRTAEGTPATKPSTLPAAADRGVEGLKVQIEFNPAMAEAYRLIGYETGSSPGTFRDGSIQPHPAGSVAAGRSATVLFEIILRRLTRAIRAASDPAAEVPEADAAHPDKWRVGDGEHSSSRCRLTYPAAAGVSGVRRQPGIRLCQ